VASAIALIDIVAAFVAMLISIGMLGTDQTFTLVPPSEKENYAISNILYLLIVEAFFTMIFVSTVLFVKYRRVSATTDGMLSNLTVAIALYVCVRMCGPLSGGGLNPSIAIAIITTDSVSYWIDPNSSNNGHLLFLFSYILGPLLGGFMAAMLLKLSVKISNETEGPMSDPSEQEGAEEHQYEIGKSNSTIQEGEGVEELGFDDEGRRNSGRGMTVLVDKQNNGKRGSTLRKQTGLEKKTARDYMA
jgi:Major intrinsic protein